MAENLQLLGQVTLVQLQPQGLILETPGKTPNGYLYDASRLVQVERLLISRNGIEATMPDGKQVLDIHHLDHPGKEYDDDDLACIGFTSHYQAVRNRYGDHLMDGMAGENILIDCKREIWPQDLGQELVIENATSGHQVKLTMAAPTVPCPEFSQFVMGDAYKHFPAAEMKATLQFLSNGRRGYLLVLQAGQESATVEAGDKVFAVDNLSGKQP